MNLAETFLRGLGIDPAELTLLITSLVADASTIKSEVLGAKGGFGAAMQHFSDRLDAQDRKLDAILTTLAATGRVQLRNGKDHDRTALDE